MVLVVPQKLEVDLAFASSLESNCFVVKWLCTFRFASSLGSNVGNGPRFVLGRTQSCADKGHRDFSCCAASTSWPTVHIKVNRVC